MLEMDVIDEQIDTHRARRSSAMTIGCARCHDHKFDPIPTKDYYALAGILKSTQVLDPRQRLALDRAAAADDRRRKRAAEDARSRRRRAQGADQTGQGRRTQEGRA